MKISVSHCLTTFEHNRNLKCKICEHLSSEFLWWPLCIKSHTIFAIHFTSLTFHLVLTNTDIKDRMRVLSDHGHVSQVICFFCWFLFWDAFWFLLTQSKKPTWSKSENVDQSVAWFVISFCVLTPGSYSTVFTRRCRTKRLEFRKTYQLIST